MSLLHTLRCSLLVSSLSLRASTVAAASAHAQLHTNKKSVRPPLCTDSTKPLLSSGSSWLMAHAHSARSISSNMAPQKSLFTLPNDQPHVALDAATAFLALTPQQQLYAHYISRASYFGGLAVLVQTSPEAPNIYRLLQRVNAAETTDELKARVLAAGVGEDDFKAFLVYGSGVFANMGNYKGFGDSKILPNMTEEAMEKLVKASKAFADDSEGVTAIWEEMKVRTFSITDRQAQLGLADKGVTTYFSDNVSQEDSDKVNRFFKHAKLEGYMNRLFKTTVDGKDSFEIRNAGVKEALLGEHDFEDAKFAVTTGDYSKLMALVADNLEKAKKYAANENEKNMLTHYVKSFTEGSLDEHKDGSRYWIRNKGPFVEMYIGFIETYRDPVGMRGEFEGFVAMVNKAQSRKFGQLVENAEDYLQRLPWPAEYEKDEFLRPDFTSLDVLAFAGSGVPAGINIPNYDEIRQSEGFKNVNLGNVISSSYKSDKKTPFATQADHELFEKYRVPSFEVQVGLHELLGHGSGKLFNVDCDGKKNFNANTINPLTSKPVDKFYDAGETYDSKFTALGSSYEECRAECVGLFLSTWKDIVAVFEHTDPAVQDDIIYVNWLSLLHAAVRGVEMYSPTTKEWKQAHSQARFVILHVLLEAGQGFVTLKETKGEDGNPDLLLTMDRTKLESVGKPAIGDFLNKLQIYKSTGDFDAAKLMYDHFSEVRDDGNHPFAVWRDIVVARKVPRKILVQANTIVEDEKLRLESYDATVEGMIKSWSDRFSKEEHKQIDAILGELAAKDKPYFTNNA